MSVVILRWAGKDAGTGGPGVGTVGGVYSLVPVGRDFSVLSKRRGTRCLSVTLSGLAREAL
jgi:hypothetical protein